jgi:glycosyltransferase involved in cell wall biosynthesis
MNEPKQTLLTIAIPTYNRRGLLQETLESVIPQVTDAMEVLIASNGSTDGTDSLMETYCRKYPFIRYIKRDVNKGIDANIHRCVLESSGKFVHLLSDDDILLPGAVDNIFDKIKRYPESGFFFYNICSFDSPFDLQKLKEPNFRSDFDLVFDDKNKFIRHIHVFATLMSSFVVNREIWNKVPDRTSYIGTDIYLSYVLFAHVAACEQVVFLARPSVAVRAQYTGSYRIFYAFAYQWSILLLKKAVALGYDRKIMKKIFRRCILTDLVPRVHAVKSGEIGSPIDRASVRYLVTSTYPFLNAWLFLYPALLLPVRLHKKIYDLYLYIESRAVRILLNIRDKYGL